MTKTPEIAVVVPTYGRPDSLMVSINTVLQQSFLNWELLVVDDNHPESENRTITRQLLAKVSDPRVQYIELPKNSGACIARNTGVSAARAPVVAFLDDDDMWHTDKLKLCLTQFQDNPDLGLLIHNIKQTYRDRVTHFDFDVKTDFYRYFLQSAMGVSCSAIIVSKQYFNEVGGFDPDLASYQDLDLMLRMSSTFRAEVLPKYLLEYQLSDAGITFNFSKKVAGARRILDKFYLNPSSQQAISGSQKLNAALGDYYMMLGQSRQALKAYQTITALGGKDFKLRLKLLLARLGLASSFRFLLNAKKRFA